MSLYQAVSSGIVQGVTEFFPVSSSGHLVILHSLFGIREPQLEFDIALHLGTLCAVVIFFWSEITRLFTKNKRHLIYIIIGTIPAGLVGIAAGGAIDSLFARPRLVSAMLILTGAWLAFAGFIRSYYARRGRKRDSGLFSSLMIGLAQAAAIMPGVSRSGATIATGMSLGLKKEEAFRFSFLLSLPAVAGAVLLKLPKALGHISGGSALNFLVGGLIAGVVGLVVLRVLSEMVRADKLHLFSIYCVIVGLAGLLLFR